MNHSTNNLKTQPRKDNGMRNRNHAFTGTRTEKELPVRKCIREEGRNGPVIE